MLPGDESLRSGRIRSKSCFRHTFTNVDWSLLREILGFELDFLDHIKMARRTCIVWSLGEF